MAIRLREPPPGAYQQVAQALSDISGQPGVGDRLNRVTDPSRINTALPHTVYTLTNADILGDARLAKARCVAWRFLVQDGARTIGALEFSSDIRGERLRQPSFDTGPFADETRQAADRAEMLSAVRVNDFELRVLRAPAVYLMALWLKALGGGEDIVVPLNPGGPNRPPATAGGSFPLSPRDLLRQLREPAATAVEFYGRPAP
jgi:hypothetical protein